MSFEKMETVENRLLGRKEISVTFSAGAGAIKRRDAAEMVAKSLGVDPSRLFTVSLQSQAGSLRLRGLLYLYDDNETGRRNLPRHIVQRNWPEKKEEKKQGK